MNIYRAGGSGSAGISLRFGACLPMNIARAGRIGMAGIPLGLEFCGFSLLSYIGAVAGLYYSFRVPGRWDS